MPIMSASRYGYAVFATGVVAVITGVMIYTTTPSPSNNSRAKSSDTFIPIDRNAPIEPIGGSTSLPDKNSNPPISQQASPLDTFTAPITYLIENFPRLEPSASSGGIPVTSRDNNDIPITGGSGQPSDPNNPLVQDADGNVSRLPDHFVADPNNPVTDVDPSVQRAVANEQDFSDSGRVRPGTEAEGTVKSASAVSAPPTTPPSGTKTPVPSAPTKPSSSSGGSGGDWKADEKSNICYKYGGSPGGQNVHEGVLTCNQGFIWSEGAHPVPVHQDDCGDPKATRCNEGATQSGGGMKYACLWQACKKGRNAIWDKHTKRCGCDDGGGGSSLASGGSGDGASVDRAEEGGDIDSTGKSVATTGMKPLGVAPVAEGPRKIFDSAKASIGSCTIGDLGCADGASKVIRNAGYAEIDHVTGTASLARELRESSNFTEITNPTAIDVRAGDIIMSETIRNETGYRGHVGFIMEDGGGTIIANSSAAGSMVQYAQGSPLGNFDNWRQFESNRGNGTVIFRPK